LLVKHKTLRLRIGELARQSGLSVDTLRHYERLKVLPVLPRTVGGFREYPPEAVRRVRIIQQALSMGFSLDELTQFFAARGAGRHPCRAVRRLAQLKLDALEQQIEAMLAARDVLRAVLQDWDGRLAQSRAQPAALLESLADAPLLDRPEKRRIRRVKRS